MEHKIILATVMVHKESLIGSLSSLRNINQFRLIYYVLGT